MITPKKLVEQLQFEMAEKSVQAKDAQEFSLILNNYNFVLALLVGALEDQREFLLKRIPYEAMANVEKLMNAQLKVIAEANKNGPSAEFMKNLGVDIIIGDFNREVM